MDEFCSTIRGEKTALHSVGYPSRFVNTD